MERNQNYVELWGVAAGEPVFSHENHTRRFDKFPLRVERLSGQNDVPVIVASEALLRVCPVDEGQSLRIVGQLRSFNNKSGQGNRLVITVFAQSIEPGDGSYFNRILLSGALCKKPVLRHTPLGRSICDVILAVNRHYGRADYLPCIAWGQTAVQIAGMDVGERLALEGRVQSRTYTKLLESGSEERTAFEVSIMQLLDVQTTLILVPAADIVDRLNGWECTVFHAQFLSLIDKRKTLQHKIHHAQQLLTLLILGIFRQIMADTSWLVMVLDDVGEETDTFADLLAGKAALLIFIRSRSLPVIPAKHGLSSHVLTEIKNRSEIRIITNKPTDITVIQAKDLSDRKCMMRFCRFLMHLI